MFRCCDSVTHETHFYIEYKNILEIYRKPCPVRHLVTRLLSFSRNICDRTLYSALQCECVNDVNDFPINRLKNVLKERLYTASHQSHIRPFPRPDKNESAQKERSRFLVPVAGLEPARLAALDFESSTSTNSITPAYCLEIITHIIRFFNI